MSTMTKPRPRAAGPAERTTPMSAEERLTMARKHITTTKRQVTQIKADTVANRSTRDQRAMRKKAEAFERLDEILAGR